MSTDDTIPVEPGSVGDQSQSKDGLILSGQTSIVNAPPAKTGDQGDTSLLTDRHRAKGDLVLVRRAVRNKWPVKPENQAALVERTMQLVADPDPKIAVSAVRAGVAMVDANIRIDLEEDKADRLDSGLATERVETPVRFIVGTDGSGV